MLPVPPFFENSGRCAVSSLYARWKVMGKTWLGGDLDPAEPPKAAHLHLRRLVCQMVAVSMWLKCLLRTLLTG